MLVLQKYDEREHTESKCPRLVLRYSSGVHVPVPSLHCELGLQSTFSLQVLLSGKAQA